MIPASLAIVLTDIPGEKRIAAIGLWSAAGVRSGRGAECRRSVCARLRVAVAVPDQRPDGPRTGGAGARSPAHGAKGLPSPRSRRNGATCDRRGPRGAGPLAGQPVGMGRRPNDRGARRRSDRRACRGAAVAAGSRSCDRDRALEGAHLRLREWRLTAVRDQPVRLDAARRPRPHSAVGVLRAGGWTCTDPWCDQRQHHRGARRPGPGCDRSTDRNGDRRTADDRLRPPARNNTSPARELHRLLAPDRIRARGRHGPRDNRDLDRGRALAAANRVRRRHRPQPGGSASGRRARDRDSGDAD